jgi:methionine aminotransferase
MQFNSKLPKQSTTIFTTMSTMAREYNAINLSQGFPNFDCDQRLIDLVSEAMNKGINQYAPMLGDVGLREAISEKFNKLYQSSYNIDDEIVITAGATQAIYNVISAFVHKGDEVILFKPAYDCYEPTIEINGGKVIPIQLHYPNYQVDWDIVRAAITSKTRMIVVNTPQNPCGTTFSKGDMLKLQEITKDTNIIILSDEVYEHMVYDGETHQSVCLFPELKKRSLITASFGKTFHTTGWKMGYCCGPSELMKEFIKVHQFNVYCVNHPVQKALATYIKSTDNYNELPTFFQRKRDLFLEAISESRFSFIPSKATYFQTVNYQDISSEKDTEFVIRLTKEFNIASIPLSVFNYNQLDEKVIRLCFAKKDETLLKAAEILNSI